MKTRRIHGDGVELAVYESGQAASEAPSVVLVHGYPDDHTVWDSVVPHLERRFHVVRYDVRGAGASGAPERVAGYRMEHLSGDLGAVLEATTHGKKAHLVGHDWGAIQSWESATDERFASRLASFTAISGPCLDHAAHWMREHAGSPVEIAAKSLRSWYIFMFHVPRLPEAVWRRGLARAWPRFQKRLEHVDSPVRPGLESDGVHGIGLYRANFLHALTRLRERRAVVPVQIVAPKDDRYISPDYSRAAERWVSELYVRHVSGGHWVVRSHGDRAARWIAEMVDHVEGRQAPLLERARAPRLAPHRGRVVVITGGGSGIGRQTAFAFARRGATVIVADVDRDGADRTALLCRHLGVTAEAHVVDVGDTGAMTRFSETVAKTYGAADVVVNNAGIGVAGKFLDTSPAEWERVLRVNLWGVLHGCRLFGAQMVARGEGGHIVNVASAAAFAPSQVLPAYATTKSAVLMLSQCLRAELASEGIGVSAICPGIIDTPITTSTVFVGTTPEAQDRARRRSAKLYRRRGLGPEAVAAAILRAVESDQAVVPVSPEAHALDLLGRLAPPLARRFARLDLWP